MSKSKADSYLERAECMSGGGLRRSVARAFGLEGDNIRGHVLELERCNVHVSTCEKVPYWLEPSKLAARCSSVWTQVPELEPCPPMQTNDADPPKAYPLELRTCKAPKRSSRQQLVAGVSAFEGLSYEFPVYAGLLERAPTEATAGRLVIVIAKLAAKHLIRALQAGNEARRRSLVRLIVDLDAALTTEEIAGCK